MEEKENETELEDDELYEDDIDESLDEGEGEKSEKKEESKEEQDKAERARQAKARREREAKEREERERDIRQKALLEGELSATKVNTFTNKPIKDEYDLKVFKLQRSIEEEGGDPIADLPERMARLEREQFAESKKEADEKKESEKAISEDIRDFRAKYQSVDVKELLSKKTFKGFSQGRLGVKNGQSLAQIYEDYEDFKKQVIEEYEQSKQEKKEEENPKTPSPNGGRKQEKTSYSNMTPAQRIEYLRKQGLIS